MKEKDGTINNFDNLPGRIFLDSNVLQVLQECGEYIFDNISISAEIKEAKNIEALRNIFLLNERAHFEFVLSENRLKKFQIKKTHPIYDGLMMC
jgi:uncharacterized protein with ATP-grasp and redox domains